MKAPTRPRTSRFTTGQPLDLGECVEALIEDDLVRPEDVGRLRSLHDDRDVVGVHPLVRIADLALIRPDDPNKTWTPDDLARWLAEQAGLPYLRIDPMEVDVEAVTHMVSQAYARRYRILPLEVHPNEVVVATSEPFALQWLRDLGQVVRREVRVVVANPVDVSRFLVEFWGVSRSVKRATDLKMQGDDKVLNFEQLLELGRAGNLTADDQHVVYIVDWLLQYAFDQRASDIHLEPRRERSNVRFRIDGHLHTIYQMPTAVMSAVTARIKVLGRMDVAEKRRPQDGRIKTRTPGGQEIELRISTMPTAFGEKCVMRIFDPEVVSLSFEELGFSPRELEIWRHMVERPHGIVLVTGPTGSGKTTTLYSTLRHLARPEINVCTVEDPIEMVSPIFNQMQVHAAIGVDFASGVRTLLRQDPDVIMIGEIRDLETAQMAIQASLTGHLVLSTLHTNDAPSAVTRLIDLGVPDYLLRGSLTGVVAQRLVRTLCRDCKKPAKLDEAGWQSLTGRWKLSGPQKMMTAVGCDNCRNTGFRGRTGIYEMLAIDETLAGAISATSGTVEFTRQAFQQGMRPLRVAAALKVIAGVTTIEEAARVVPPEALVG